MPTEGDRALAQIVLSLRALGVLEDLVQGRLPDIQVGVAFEMARRDLVVCSLAHAPTSAAAAPTIVARVG